MTDDFVPEYSAEASSIIAQDATVIFPWSNPVQPLFEARFEKFFWGGDIDFQIYSDDHLDEVYAELLKTLTRPPSRPAPSRPAASGDLSALSMSV